MLNGWLPGNCIFFSSMLMSYMLLTMITLERFKLRISLFHHNCDLFRFLEKQEKYMALSAKSNYSTIADTEFRSFIISQALGPRPVIVFL